MNIFDTFNTKYSAILTVFDLISTQHCRVGYYFPYVGETKHFTEFKRFQFKIDSRVYHFNFDYTYHLTFRMFQ